MDIDTETGLRLTPERHLRWEVARKALMNLFFTGRAAMTK